eukprot:1195813-Prorocentrum_minimum.AAC.5
MKDQSCPIDLIAFPRLWERLVGLQDASTTEYSGGSELSFKGEMHSNLHLHQEAVASCIQCPSILFTSIQYIYTIVTRAIFQSSSLISVYSYSYCTA